MSSKWILPVVVLGGLGLGGYFLFGTKEGKRMVSELLSGIGGGGDDEGASMEDISRAARTLGYDDPFKYYDDEDNADAWDPTSKRYKEIVRGTMERAEKARRDKKKKIQKEYIEAYLADAF